MEVSGSHGRGGLLVQESNEAPPNGTRGVTECAGHDETDEVGVRVEPEVVLPAQVFDRRADLLQPEKRLMLAILEDATATLLRHPTPRHAGKRRALRETEAWLDSPDTESPFAFIRICEALGLDAQWLRRGLARAQVAREGEPGKDRRRLVRRMAGTRSFRSASVNAAMATRTTQRPTRARADSASGSVSRMCGRLSGRGAESVPSVIFSLRRAPRAGP